MVNEYLIMQWLLGQVKKSKCRTDIIHDMANDLEIDKITACYVVEKLEEVTPQ